MRIGGLYKYYSIRNTLLGTCVGFDAAARLLRLAMRGGLCSDGVDLASVFSRAQVEKL